MNISRSDFVNKISDETSMPPHEVENVMNAVFAYFKQLLTDEDVNRIADRIESEDLKSVWLTSSAAKNPAINSGKYHKQGLH